MFIRQRDAFVLGSISDIVVAVSVRNVEENAYNARLIATFPRELTLLSPVGSFVFVFNKEAQLSVL